MTPNELSDRLWDLAARVAKVVDALPDTRMGRHIAGQLCRSGTSSTPNYDEACAAESRADFIHKIHVAWKEVRETRGWLQFIAKLELIAKPRIAPLVDESEQVSRILCACLATAKGKTRRSASPKSSILNSFSAR